MALVDVLMPQLGTSVVEGTVVEWHVALGGPVTAEATICDISTDKIDSECPAPVSGTLAEILVAAGVTVEVGAVLARIATDGETVGEGGGGSDGPAIPKPAPAAAANSPAADPSVTAAPAPAAAVDANSVVRSSPVARRIAGENGVDLAAVPGSGRGGRVTKKDVLAFIASGGSDDAAEPPLHSDSPYRPDPAPAPPGPAAPAPTAAAPPPTAAADHSDLGGVTARLSRMRQRIGAAMLASQQAAATCHTAVECEMTRVEARRAELGLTALPLVARAVVETLAEFPDLNATLDGETITRYQRVHLGIAVSLGDDGLIVPVVHDAQNLSPQGIGQRIGELAKRARSNELEPDEVRGATFTITSPGAFGALWATPVIDLPQVGILDLEAITRRPVVVADPTGNESIAIRSIATLILGWDHRALDGVYAARFLTAVRARLES